MQSVTSNAVAKCLEYKIGVEVDTGKTFNGKKVYRKVISNNFEPNVQYSWRVSNEVPQLAYQVAVLSLSYIFSSRWVRQPWFNSWYNKNLTFMEGGVLDFMTDHPSGTAVIVCEYCKEL